jgi:sarcosine oxidase subunit gamma
VAKLIAKSATEGLLPLKIGGLTLADATPARLTAVAHRPGKEKAAAAVLQKLGLGWPAPDRAIQNGKAAILWSSRAQAFLVNAAPEGLEASAALTDISDGWVVLALEGKGAADALARLVPLDLSPAAFPEAATARSGLGHMMLLLHRAGAERFHLYVFRSMAATAIHELEAAMKSLAARAQAC